VFGLAGGEFILYMPIFGNDDPEPNFSQNPTRTGTVNNAAKSEHPPIELMENYL